MNHADKDMQCSRIVNKLEFVAAVLQSMQLAEVLPDIRAGPIDGRALAEVVHIAERERNRFEVVVRIADAFDIAIADIGLERAAEGGDVSTDRRRIAVHEERARHIVGQHTLKAGNRLPVRRAGALALEVLAGRINLGNAEIISTGYIAVVPY